MENTAEILIKAKKIIAFFDLFDYPLTAFEIWKFLDKQTKIDEIIASLESGEQAIGRSNGFYFLAGRENIVMTRIRRYNYTNRKLKIAARFIKIFKRLSFIKVVALANSIGAHNLRDGSDIDIFVICSPRRIWQTRFVLASAAKFLNRRPTSGNKRDKICLSFYLAADNLNLDNLMLSGGDPYFFYWLRTLIVLYNKDGVYEKFLAANHVSAQVASVAPANDAAIGMTISRQSIFFNFLESFLKKVQLIIMSPALKQAMNNSAGVVVNDQVLKLYLRDNRQEYAEKYGNKIRQIFTENN